MRKRLTVLAGPYFCAEKAENSRKADHTNPI
jgi:hypothetical protein